MAIEFDFENGDLVVNIRGWDMVWALHRSIRVPVSAVTKVYVDAKSPLADQLAFRIRGGSMPGVVMAGRFSVWKKHQRFEGERQFWLTKRKSEVLVIDTSVASPSRFVFEMPDARAAQRELSQRLEHESGVAS